MSDKAVHIALYPSDWLAGTRGLTPAETGIYITLVCMMYERQGPLPFDHARLARMCNCPAGTFKKLLAVLLDEGKLIETPEGLWQRRVEHEIAAARTAIDEASDRAKRAADARWSKAKPQSDRAEIVTVKPQSVEQQGARHTAEKDNENSMGQMHGQCPSNANQNQNQRVDADADTRGPDRDPGLMEAVCIAAGRNLGDLNGNATRFGMSPAETDALRRWQGDLGLSAESIVAEIRHQASRMRGPPNSLTYFTPGLRELAARLSAPPLEPSKGPTHDRTSNPPRRVQPGHGQQLSGLAGAAMRRRAAREQGHEG